MAAVAVAVYVHKRDSSQIILSESGKNELIFGFKQGPCKCFTTARDEDTPILVERDEFADDCYGYR